MRRARWVFVGVAGLAAAGLIAACDDTNVHLLYGEQYDPTYMCMLPDQSIDVINGPDPGESCSPVCITATLDGADYVFISTTCPPYNPYPAESQNGALSSSDPCVAAFKAYTANIQCGPDGGPPEGGVPDAGGDARADASADAGVDATLDAGSDAPAVPEAGTDATTEAAPVEAGPDATIEAAPPEAGPEASADSALE